MNNPITEYILKHSRKKDKELKYDIMPSLLEFIERPAHKAGTVIILGVFTLLIAAVIWACLSKIDVVVTSSGSVQPIGNLNVVQSYAGGVVEAINIEEGEYVQAGDVLIHLNTETLDVDEKQLQSQKKILEEQQKIYQKIKAGEDVSAIKVSDYDAELQPYIQAILDADTSYKNTLANLEKEKSNADLNQQIGQLQLEEYQANGTEREAESQKLINQQYALAVEQADLQINDTKTQYSAQINSKISENDTQLIEIESNLEKYQLSIAYQDITAPVSGYVNSISVNTIGDTVTSAQELVTIVPDDTSVEMVCYVQNMDIADVEEGMTAEIKLEAYPYNKFDTISGTVK